MSYEAVLIYPFKTHVNITSGNLIVNWDKLYPLLHYAQKTEAVLSSRDSHKDLIALF